MYIGTDMSIKTSTLSKAMDGLKFTTMVNKYSIPHSSKYGVSIDANSYNIWDVAHVSLLNAICGLDMPELKLSGLRIDPSTNIVYASMSLSDTCSDNSLSGVPEKINLGVSVKANIN